MSLGRRWRRGRWKRHLQGHVAVERGQAREPGCVGCAMRKEPLRKAQERLGGVVVRFLIFLIVFFSYNVHSTLFCVSFRCVAKWPVSYFTEQSSRYFQDPPDTTHSYYYIIDCIPCAELDIPVTAL